MGGCSSDKNKVDTGIEDVRYRNVAVTGGNGALGASRLIDEWSGFPVGADKRVFLVTMIGRSSKEHIDQALVDAHLDHLRELSERGQLDSAGVHASGDRGIKILLASSIEEAGSIAASDPLLIDGYYTSYEIVQIGRP